MSNPFVLAVMKAFEGKLPKAEKAPKAKAPHDEKRAEPSADADEPPCEHDEAQRAPQS